VEHVVPEFIGSDFLLLAFEPPQNAIGVCCDEKYFIISFKPHANSLTFADVLASQRV